jgi:hypothetical protein
MVREFLVSLGKLVLLPMTEELAKGVMTGLFQASAI